MGIYHTKLTDYGYKEKISRYRHTISYQEEDNGHIPLPREKYENMDEWKKKKSDERRMQYYKRKTIELVEIALMNPDLNTVITLTFREPVTSYEYALAKWQLFLKRLRHTFDFALKYICVWEYQRKRGQKEGMEHGGVFHFHALMNTGFLDHKKLEKIWGNGFVWIEKIPDTAQREKSIKYVTKYISKEIVYRIEHGEDVRGQRFFFTSNNLLKPTELLLEERLNLEDMIMEHLEDMIKDGSYNIKDCTGKIINQVDYIEFKKQKGK